MKKGLGRGLDSLLIDNSIETADDSPMKMLHTADVEPNRDQPRKHFDKEKLDELANSLAEHGLVQPIVVRQMDNGRYQIISGERRWRAARIAGLTEIPAIVRSMDDKEVAEISLIENLQREDLNIVEEAEGYRRLIDEFHLTQEAAAKRVGKSRPVIANALRILALPKDVLQMAIEGKLSSGHARTLLPLCECYSESEVTDVAKKIISTDMTVRETENAVRLMLQKKEQPPKKLTSRNHDIYFRDLEKQFTAQWGRKVKINTVNGKKGKIEFEFYDKDDLNALIARLQETEM